MLSMAHLSERDMQAKTEEITRMLSGLSVREAELVLDGARHAAALVSVVPPSSAIGDFFEAGRRAEEEAEQQARERRENFGKGPWSGARRTAGVTR